MTQAAQIAKPNARKAQIGEMYVCARCQGEGGKKGWHVQFGTCFKCNGAGVIAKVDPNGTRDVVRYKVQTKSGFVVAITTEDRGCENVAKTLWIGDNVEFTVTGNIWSGVIVGKCLQVYHNTKSLINEKKSRDYDNIKTF